MIKIVNSFFILPLEKRVGLCYNKTKKRGMTHGIYSKNKQI